MPQMDDDNSVLEKLMNELEMDSALYRLNRIGFKPISSDLTNHLVRYTRDKKEELFIELDGHGHFRIQYTVNCYTPRLILIVTTWDEWVFFIRSFGPVPKNPNQPNLKEQQA